MIGIHIGLCIGSGAVISGDKFATVLPIINSSNVPYATLTPTATGFIGVRGTGQGRALSQNFISELSGASQVRVTFDYNNPDAGTAVFQLTSGGLSGTGGTLISLGSGGTGTSGSVDRTESIPAWSSIRLRFDKNGTEGSTLTVSNLLVQII